ncbi:MAG TPA: hypothetical protein VF595_01695 [Tepidisphaeraceae bacterium]
MRPALENALGRSVVGITRWRDWRALAPLSLAMIVFAANVTAAPGVVTISVVVRPMAVVATPAVAAVVVGISRRIVIGAGFDGALFDVIIELARRRVIAAAVKTGLAVRTVVEVGSRVADATGEGQKKKHNRPASHVSF